MINSEKLWSFFHQFDGFRSSKPSKLLTWLDTKICTGPASAKKPIWRIKNIENFSH
jgi:hypothetical protein